MVTADLDQEFPNQLLDKCLDNIILTLSGSVTKRLVVFCFKTLGEFGLFQTEQLAHNNVFRLLMESSGNLKKKKNQHQGLTLEILTYCVWGRQYARRYFQKALGEP